MPGRVPEPWSGAPLPSSPDLADLAWRHDGLLVPALRPPSVSPGTARLRISLTAGHTAEDVDRLAAALCESRVPHH